MKINDSLSSTQGLPNSPPAPRADKAGDNAKVATTPSHNVQISPMSVQLQAMQNTQASGAVFEAKKVEEIKLAISEGRFQVDAEKVADGLLETVKDLLNSRRQPT
ncbi:flagellar biosynthesis anti-sigma factor FlgM [Undibacterium sp. LX40W]|uniref:Negative regulator of flagellin synthesis n=1 Tax=Undibacterium nitidum TaxID=2762298 RepID=A0A923HS83_9BURK|nr:flagellar biosynthesis anti-sigma factor FlgM [Undibacterium nitidum]MBC3880149.1 flagellar biosynthesis anti-sigma factor FlgM [Undibacterium nitidum]MBC3891115.1 flagellar biosynthesis anti-sigma factor FlgM [Undibacterium sp. LX40W]